MEDVYSNSELTWIEKHGMTFLLLTRHCSSNGTVLKDRAEGKSTQLTFAENMSARMAEIRVIIRKSHSMSWKETAGISEERVQ